MSSWRSHLSSWRSHLSSRTKLWYTAKPSGWATPCHISRLTHPFGDRTYHPGDRTSDPGDRTSYPELSSGILARILSFTEYYRLHLILIYKLFCVYDIFCRVLPFLPFDFLTFSFLQLLPVIIITSLACVITNDFYFHIPNIRQSLQRRSLTKNFIQAWAYIWLHGYFRFIPLG